MPFSQVNICQISRRCCIIGFSRNQKIYILQTCYKTTTELKPYLKSLFNGALDRGMDWVEGDFSIILDKEYERHGYPMLNTLKEVIIDPNTDDWCVEIACAFYNDLAQRKYKEEIRDILYEILIKHKNWIYAGVAARSLLYLNDVEKLELAFKTINEKKRKERVLRYLLYYIVQDIRRQFAINQITDLVATADEKWMPHVKRLIQDFEETTLEIA